MAARGTKPKPPDLKIVTGNPGRRPLPEANTNVPVRSTPLRPHQKLTRKQAALWKRFIDTAWWLSDHDVPFAYMFVCLQEEHDKAPLAMNGVNRMQLRVLGSELHLLSGSRARAGIVADASHADPTEKYFS